MPSACMQALKLFQECDERMFDTTEAGGQCLPARHHFDRQADLAGVVFVHVRRFFHVLLQILRP